jgi:pimeloyl-ACP methyl ester carboxylesterase
MKLAVALAGAFYRVLRDRRGRGLSGPYRDDFAVDEEVKDVRALVAETGAGNIFGLSSGALVALRVRATWLSIGLPLSSLRTAGMGAVPCACWTHHFLSMPVHILAGNSWQTKICLYP